MNENPAYVCICGIFFVPLRKFAQEMNNYHALADAEACAIIAKQIL